MSEDATRAPLPVVAAWVWTDDEQPFCRMQWSVAEKEADDLPAVAVPWALFHDTAFQNACMDRWQRGAASVFGAIAAELRARANFNQETTP
jgi:hypothetical protein